MSLCSIYALRSSEVARLRLNDFDWKEEKFTVSPPSLLLYPVTLLGQTAVSN